LGCVQLLTSGLMGAAAAATGRAPTAGAPPAMPGSRQAIGSTAQAYLAAAGGRAMFTPPLFCFA
jgi:hypothetical protein